MKLICTALLVVLSGCAAPPHSPTPIEPITPSVLLTIQVRIYGSEDPLQGVRVSVDDIVRGETDGAGVVHIPVKAGAVSVDVAAPGYKGFGVDADVKNDERWTFYLQPH